MSAATSKPGLALTLVARHAGHELAISSMRQVLIIPIHGSTPSSWKIAVHKPNARMQEKVPNSFKC